jgi:hypothetical protein
MEGQLIEPQSHELHHERLTWKQWLKQPRNKLILILGLVGLIIIVGTGIAIYRRYLKPIQTANGTLPLNEQISPLPGLNTEQPTPTPTTETSPLDGTEVDKALAHRRPLAVMVENHPDARPQAGLSSAANVWESMTEGGITRFLAVFGPHDAEKVGPVRSARPYFIAWASGYHALYAHAGGSEAGLTLLSGTKNVVDLPHTGAYFHREPRAGIASEHTLFTSTKDLYEYANSKKVATDTQDFAGFKFQDDAAVDKRPDSASISIKFSSASYDVKWDYDKEKNAYRRSLAGNPHKDKNSGEQIITKNVVTLNVDRRYDSGTNHGKGEWFMTTEGEGGALLFRDGQKIEAKWKKPSAGEMLKLYTDTGEELAFDRGQIWFEITPPDASVSSQ